MFFLSPRFHSSPTGSDLSAVLTSSHFSSFSFAGSETSLSRCVCSVAEEEEGKKKKKEGKREQREGEGQEKGESDDNGEGGRH